MTPPDPPARPLEDAARASGALVDLWLHATAPSLADTAELELATARLVDFVRRHPADLEFTLLERLDELVHLPDVPPADDDEPVPPLIVWLLGLGGDRPRHGEAQAAALREAMSAPALMAIMARLRRDHLDALPELLRGMAEVAAGLVRRAGRDVLDTLDEAAPSPSWRTLVVAGAARDPRLLEPVFDCDTAHTHTEAELRDALARHFGGDPDRHGTLELEDPSRSLVNRDEPMAGVIAHDAALLHDLGIAPSELARRLRTAIDTASDDNDESAWRCEVTDLALAVHDPLHDDDASFVHGLGRRQFALSHPEHGTIRGSDLAPLLIERACFFGGTRSPLRVDPVLAARMLGLHPSDRRPRPPAHDP